MTMKVNGTLEDVFAPTRKRRLHVLPEYMLPDQVPIILAGCACEA